MSEKHYAVEMVSPAEAESLIQRFRGGPENLNARRSLVIPGGFELVGEFSLTARDAKSGAVAWEHADKNLITDWGRRQWMENKWAGGMTICFAPSTESPQSGRYSLGSDGSQCFESVSLTPVNAPATHTKTFSTTYTTPAQNRTLGTILLCRTTSSAVLDKGIVQVSAFALLTPPKTQTTTQTLEVVYKVSMNPIA